MNVGNKESNPRLVRLNGPTDDDIVYNDITRQMERFGDLSPVVQQMVREQIADETYLLATTALSDMRQKLPQLLGISSSIEEILDTATIQ